MNIFGICFSTPHPNPLPGDRGEGVIFRPCPRPLDDQMLIMDVRTAMVSCLLSCGIR